MLLSLCSRVITLYYVFLSRWNKWHCVTLDGYASTWKGKGRNKGENDPRRKRFRIRLESTTKNQIVNKKLPHFPLHSSMEKVAILGSAFPAIQLSNLLQSNHCDVKVIDTLSNREYTVSLSLSLDLLPYSAVPSYVPYSHIDEWSVSKLSPHLKGVESVILIIPFDIPLENQSPNDITTGNEEIIRSELSVPIFILFSSISNGIIDLWSLGVEHIMDAISHSSIRRLIYLGDAYSCLPQDDNYGVSEQKHQSVTHFQIVLAFSFLISIISNDPNKVSLSSIYIFLHYPLWSMDFLDFLN